MFVQMKLVLPLVTPDIILMKYSFYLTLYKNFEDVINTFIL